MDATHGATAPTLTPLSQGIREYSLFQGVQRVLNQLAEAHPGLSDEALYERLEFQANPSMGFPGSDIDRVQFFEERGELLHFITTGTAVHLAALRWNVDGKLAADLGLTLPQHQKVDPVPFVP